MASVSLTEAQQIKLAAISNGGGLNSAVVKLGLDPIDDNVVDNPIDKWLIYLRDNPDVKAKINSQDQRWVRNANGYISESKKSYAHKYDYEVGGLDPKDYTNASAAEYGRFLTAYRAAHHYKSHGQSEGREVAVVDPDLGSKYEQIAKALETYELDKDEARRAMFSKYSGLSGFNEWNRITDQFRNAVEDVSGKSMDEYTANFLMSQATNEVAEFTRNWKEYKVGNSSKPSFPSVFRNFTTETDTAFTYDGEVDEVTDLTTPYDFNGRSRYLAETLRNEYDRKGYGVESEEYVQEKYLNDTGWTIDPKLGYLYVTDNGDDKGKWTYAADYGWLFLHNSALDEDRLETGGWVWTEKTGWMQPIVNSSGKMFWAMADKDQNGSQNWMYIEKGSLPESNKYYVLDDNKEWVDVGYQSTEFLKDSIDLVADPKAYVESGNEITDEMKTKLSSSGEYNGQEALSDALRYVSLGISGRAASESSSNGADSLADVGDSGSTGSSSATGSIFDPNEDSGDVPTPISYNDFSGDLESQAFDYYEQKLNELAREHRYKGRDAGLIESLLKRSEVYRDMMDSLGGSDNADAQRLIDSMVESAAAVNAERGNMAGALDMFDERGGGMLDPRMSLDEKLAIRGAKPSKYADLVDVENGDAEYVGQIIRNPDYDPNLSYYFEYRNPQTGELETRAFRPDMPGKQPFMQNQERLIDMSNAVISDHMDKLSSRGDDGLTDYERQLDQTVNKLKSEGLLADKGGDDLYTREGIKQLNYIFGDDEDSYLGEMNQFNNMNKFLRESKNYYDNLSTQKQLDDVQKVRTAIEDTAPIENARLRGADRLRLARFGGGSTTPANNIRTTGSTLFENNIRPKTSAQNIDSVTGLGKTYTQDQINAAGIQGGVANAPKMSDELKNNKFAKNLVLPG